MASSLRAWLAAALLAPALAAAASLEGVQVDDSVRAGKTDLVLNGLGLRTRFIFNVYVAGLYLPEKARSAETALAMKGPKRMTLVMLRDVGAEEFGEALLKGLRSNVPNAELEKLKDKVDDLLGRIAAIGEAKKGMVIDLDYSANPGTTMKVNGVPQGKPIGGEAFFHALLSIWLGAKPVQPDLKDALLGGSAK